MFKTAVVFKQSQPTNNDFVLYAVGSHIIYQKCRANNRFLVARYRLCVCASGSVITKIFRFFTLINISFLHLGQNKGKFFNSVSERILMRVLLLQKGHNNHSKSPIEALCIIFLIATPNNNVQTEFTVLCLPRFFCHSNRSSIICCNR